MERAPNLERCTKSVTKSVMGMCSMTASGSNADRKNSSTVDGPNLCFTCARISFCQVCQKATDWATAALLVSCVVWHMATDVHEADLQKPAGR